MKNSMDSKPLVSVVMPIYGVEKYIENSVKSVINQTYDNIELILVDDGSPDKSVDIAERVLKENSYPYQLIRQANQGQGEARNTGIRQANGKWILFLDSDDIILPETILELVDSVEKENGGVDLAFSKFHLVFSPKDIKNSRESYKTEVLDAKKLQKLFLLRKKIVMVAGTLFKKEMLLKKELYFESIPWSEDQHFVWKFLSYAKNAVFVDRAFYQYLQHSGSIMSASGIDKMIQSYPSICGLTAYYEKGSFVGRYLVSRWVMGTLNAAAGISDYHSWKHLFDAIEGKLHMKVLLSFPSITVKSAAFIGLICKKAYYLFARNR